MVDLKSAYFSMEDKWYGFVDTISDKIPFVGTAIDKVEEKNIPSFPLAIALLVIIILAIFFLFAGSGSALTINVNDSSNNPLEGANVSVWFNGDLIDERETNEAGSVTFFLANESYNIKINKDGYVTKTENNVTPGLKDFALNAEDVTLTKAISLKEASGKLIQGSGLIRYSCITTGEQKVGNYSGGVFTADFDGCDEISLDSVSGYVIVNGTAKFSGANNILLSEEVNETGTITATVNSTDDLLGVRVSIVGEDGTPTQVKTITTGTTTVVFENVPTKKYYITAHDPNGNFADYDGSSLGEIKELTKDETLSFNLTIAKTTSEIITVNIKDFETGLPVVGTDVKISIINNGDTVDTEVSGVTGQVEFNVAKDSEYIVSAEHLEYIVGQTQSAKSGDTITFNLVKATEANSKTLVVKVVDPSNNPIRNVHVTVKRLDDTEIGEKTTGSSGEVEFYNVEPASYYAYAVKDGYDGTTSTTIQVLPLRENILPITLDIGEGDIDLTVKDNSFATLSGAKVSVINYFTGDVEEEKTTNDEGKISFTIRQDKKVFFIVSKEDYLDYYTAAFNPDADTTDTKEIVLAQGNDRVTAKIIGIYNDDGEIGAEKVIGEGRYKIKALLEIPQGNFAEAGMHIRTGKANNNEINLMEEDLAKLGLVHSSADSVLKGTSFSPPNNYSTDSSNFTNGTAKWIEAKLKNPKTGIYEIETELIIDSVNPNSGINLWYRGYAKGATTLRSTPNNNSGHELYASASNYFLVSGTTSMCKTSFCMSKEITTLSGTNTGRTQFISNKFNAKQDNTYVLSANLISRKAISNAVLEIDSSGITVNNIKVNGIDAEDNVTLGTIAQDSVTTLEIEFVTSSAGTANIKLLVNSATATELENNTIISVASNKKFKLDIIPKQIIPYINNIIFVEAIDANKALKDVLVEIQINNDVVATLETNSEGLAQYELTSPSIGDVITITATKEGYDAISVTKDVDERLLLITPPEISETIKIGSIASIENMILLENATVAKLNIKRITVSGELDDYLTITLKDAEGQTMDAGEDANYILKIKPNSKAKLLQVPKTVTGSVEIITGIDDASQTFTNKIPVSIRLSMPGFLDSDKCLHITPNNLEFIANSNEVTKTIEIENTCVAEGINVNLFEIEAKLNEASRLGTIAVTGNGFSNANINDSYSKIADILKSGEKETLSVRFMPSSSISSGTQTVNLSFRAKNIAEEDVSETVETTVTNNISLSNLSSCVTIEKPSSGVILNIAGYNLGYNRIANSNLAARTQSYPGFRNASMPYGMTNSLPYMGQTQSQGNSQYANNSFIIKNDCAADVEIDLDVDSRLNVNDEELSISAGNDATVNISPGYTLGNYEIKVNANLGEEIPKNELIETVSVTVRRLGDIDRDCIKINVSKITFNSFLYKTQQYKVYNSCYNTGIVLNRTRTVSIQCDAPNRTTNQQTPYLQVGMESLYSNQYPTGANQTYNQYVQPTQGGSNNCSMIAGTRTRTQRLVNNTEEITFEVMPSAQYMPQRRLFDESRNTYGLFQNLADIRQWATETDGRTEVYGNLQVAYTNQYGSSQQMDFPITIEDNWRILESVDSAINWGDPRAKPQECISKDAKDNSLNIRQYWISRGKGRGLIPNAEYNPKGIYTYIAEPPAVKIGPAPSAGTIYPQTTWRSTDRQEAGTKNCGLLDTLSNLKYEPEFGGVKIGVETLRKGSLTNNSLGPNLIVTLDRSNIAAQCVYINTTVTADLTRRITWEKANVSWKLTAIVTKPGFKAPANFNAEEYCLVAGSVELNCEEEARKFAKEGYTEFIKKHKACAGKISKEEFERIIKDDPAAVSACETNGNDFGFDKIDLLSKDDLIKSGNAETYCETNFCNNDMLQAYILNKYNKVYDALGEIGTQTLTQKAQLRFGPGKPRPLEEIYKIADVKELNMCDDKASYYTKSDSTLITKDDIDFSEFGTTDVVNAIKIDDTTLKDDTKTGSIVAMKSILTKMITKDTKEEYFLQSGETFVPIKAYKEILENAKVDSTTVTISCTQKTDYTLEEIQNLTKNSAKIVKLIKVGKDTYDSSEIEAIYKYNSKLKAVNDVAEIEGLYLTANAESDLSYNDKIFTTDTTKPAVKNYKIDLTNEAGPGKYNVVLQGDFVELAKAAADHNPETKVDLQDKEDVGKAGENVLLQRGFDIKPVASSHKLASKAVIVDNSGNFYERTPVMLSINVPSNENNIKYTPAPTAKIAIQDSLIKWKNGSLYANDKRVGDQYLINLNPSSVARTISGIYYYPSGGLLIMRTSNADKVDVHANGVVFNTNKSTNIEAETTGIPLELELTNPTLSQILSKMDDKVCITSNGSQIIWNESQIR
jgi:hypothetical protein